MPSLIAVNRCYIEALTFGLIKIISRWLIITLTLQCSFKAATVTIPAGPAPITKTSFLPVIFSKKNRKVKIKISEYWSIFKILQNCLSLFEIFRKTSQNSQEKIVSYGFRIYLYALGLLTPALSWFTIFIDVTKK